MRVLFCLTSINALGEAFSTAEFAKRLIFEGNDCFFIAPKLGLEFLKSFGFLDNSILVLTPEKHFSENINLNYNYSLFVEFNKKANPQIVIVADWHMFDQDGMSINKSYSLTWFSDSVRMGTFDHMGFAPDGIKTKKYGGFDFQEKVFHPLPNRFSFIIRPCPHHTNVNQVERGNIYYWGIYNSNLKIDERKKQNLRSEYLTEGEKLVLHPIGFWQERIMQKLVEQEGVKINYYNDIFLPILFSYIGSVNIHVKYIIISGNVKREERIELNSKLTIIKKPPLRHELFIEHLLSSDLFITDNLMSSNLGKAVFGNIPSIVFTSSLEYIESAMSNDLEVTKNVKEKLQVLKVNNLLFPYCSFPVGLNELELMYERNSFSSTFYRQELYNEGQNKNLLSNILQAEGFSDSLIDNQNRYIQANKKLLSENSILLNVIN